MKIIFIPIALFLFSSCSHNISRDNVYIREINQLPDYRNRKDIIDKLGYPSEIIISKDGKKTGPFPVVDWIYYFQSSDDDNVFPVYYAYRQGKCVAATSLGIPTGSYYKVLNSDNVEDLKLILLSRKNTRMEIE